MLKQLATYYSTNKFLVWSLFICSCWYAAISLVNHYCFRTYSLDLGLYTNALYDYAHFQFNDSLTFKSESENLLADHFDLYLPLFSPLSYIFGTYTLLVVQICSVLFGAIGIYKYVEYIDSDPRSKRSVLLYFLLFFGIFSSLAYDYHSNTVAAMFIPWLFLKINKNQWKAAWFFLFFILIAKENMALWMIFVTTGLLWIHRKNREKFKQITLMVLVCATYTFLIIGVVMPALSNTGSFQHFKYNVLGANFSEAIKTIFLHPWETFKLLFKNHNGLPLYDYVKVELWVFILLVGFLAISKPIYWWMLLPIFGQKLFHNDPKMWGVQWQYTVEFAGILAIANYEVIKNMPKKIKNCFLILVPILSFATTIRLMDNTIAYTEKARLRVYKKAHYNREFSISEAHQVLKLIPKDAVVSAQSAFVPHLALRDTIYTFPDIVNATYLLISPVDNPYPMDEDTFFQKIDEINQSGEWEAIHKSDEIILYKRIQ
ncbi:MAG TPA: DUF2079 domain-containing protein [Taishania sp.]|nr:DUF2079 domain-containing protein [Taishania sp.]